MPVYKDSEKGTWYASFYYRDWSGKNRKKKKEGFKRQADAKAFERDFIKQQTGSPDMTFGALVELYLADCKARVRQTTYYNKARMFEKHLLPAFEDIPLNKITPVTVRNWQNGMLSKDYTQTYLKIVHSQVSAAFNYGVKYYGLKENPAAKCGAMGKKHADEMHFWTLEQFKQFEEAISDKYLSLVMFNALFWTGMRSGELMALTAGDVRDDTIIINKSYARLDGKDIISPPKTPKGKREVMLPKALTELLTDYISKLPRVKSSARLFPVTKAYLGHEMRRGCLKAEIPKIRVHDLRHSHASMLIELGFSPLLIAERLGHENIETTLKTYSHLYPNKQAELIVKLDELQK